jgi:hypothetical protein
VLYIAASLITVVGLVLQDTVADAMSTEVVRRSTRESKRPEAGINAELGAVQVLGRIAFSGGAFVVAGLRTGSRATWFALMASLMNPALQASGIATKYLNRIFVVERSDYDNLGTLMIVVSAIALLLPLATIGLVMTQIKPGAAAGTRTKDP